MLCSWPTVSPTIPIISARYVFKSREYVDGILIGALCCIPCKTEIVKKKKMPLKKSRIYRSVRFLATNSYCSTAKCLFKTMQNYCANSVYSTHCLIDPIFIFYMIIMCHRYYNFIRLISPFSFALWNNVLCI